MGEELHADHRKRMLKKFRECGLDAFHDHEVLETLLFFSIPRVNTNDIAHRLLNRFGSFHEVFDAPYEQLREIEGIGDRSATFIKLLCSVIARYETSRTIANTNSAKLMNKSLIADYFIPQFTGETEEVLLAAFLDGKNRVIKCEEMGRGSNTRVSIDPFLILRRAIIYNAAGVVLAHNHPNGSPLPSFEDIEVTQSVKNLLSEMGIYMLGHCIVSGTVATFTDNEDVKYSLGGL